MGDSAATSRRLPRRRDSIPDVPDSRIKFSCDRHDEWSEPCFIKTSGSRTFPARVCVRAGTQIMADVKLYKNLRGGIQGLFERFAEDLVQQKTPNLTESSRFSQELLGVLRTDYVDKHAHRAARPRTFREEWNLIISCWWRDSMAHPRKPSRPATYFHRATGIFCTFDISRPTWSSQTWAGRSWQSR